MINNFIFVVTTPKGQQEYSVEVDDETSLIDVLRDLIRTSQGTEYPIRLYDEKGQEVQYSVFWNQEELFLDNSLSNMGVPPGSVISVYDPSEVAAYENTNRVQEDRAGLLRLATANPEHLRVKGLSPGEIEIILMKIKGISGLDDKKEPIIKEDEHILRLTLSRDYPILRPVVIAVTDIFHPNANMDKKRDVCLFFEWYPLDSNLIYACVQCCKLIQYWSVNLDDDHPRMNLKAKEWYLAYKEKHPDFFPLSRVGLTLPLKLGEKRVKIVLHKDSSEKSTKKQSLEI
ncbi:MAG: hypothetical protein AB1422_00260 [bacterium]